MSTDDHDPYASDEALWEGFASSTVPERFWTHRAHLRVGWMFTKRHPSVGRLGAEPQVIDEAHVLMRVGIIRLNAFHQLVETPSRGYHETLTRVWLTLIHGLLPEVDVTTSSEFVDTCGVRLSKEAVLRHYSREKIMGLRARAVFVEPDLEPFASFG